METLKLVPATNFQNIVLSMLILIDMCNRNVLTQRFESERCILWREHICFDSWCLHINTLQSLQQSQDMGTNSCSSAFWLPYACPGHYHLPLSPIGWSSFPFTYTLYVMRVDMYTPVCCCLVCSAVWSGLVPVMSSINSCCSM